MLASWLEHCIGATRYLNRTLRVLSGALTDLEARRTPSNLSRPPFFAVVCTRVVPSFSKLPEYVCRALLGDWPERRRLGNEFEVVGRAYSAFSSTHTRCTARFHMQLLTARASSVWTPMCHPAVHTMSYTCGTSGRIARGRQYRDRCSICSRLAHSPWSTSLPGSLNNPPQTDCHGSGKRHMHTCKWPGYTQHSSFCRK